MIIGGVRHFSTLDFPGRNCLTVFTQGCNRSCSYCHNPHLISAKTETDWKWSDVWGLIVDRRNFLDAIVFSGGEPCIHKDLPWKLSQVQHAGFLTGLHTNGDYLTEEIAQLCDYILLSHANDEKIRIASHVDAVTLSRVTGDNQNLLRRVK